MIRLARPDDLPLLPAIEDAAGMRFVGTSAALDATLPNVPATAFAVAQRRRSLWVAVDADDVPIGFLLAEPHPPWLHIQELDVHPDHKGQGLGRALIAAAAQASGGLACHGLSLTTYRDIAWNAPWYRRLGFVEVAAAARPAWLTAKLAHEAEHGIDPASRCAMTRPA